MNKIVYFISLDFGKTLSGIMVNALKGDSARSIKAALYKDGHPYVIDDDTSASIKALLPSGTIVEDTCQIQNSYVEYDLSSEITSMEGIVECEFCLVSTSTNKQITSPKFMIRVKENLEVGE